MRFSDLLEPRLFKVLGIGIALAVLQQWCGINVFFNYAEDIFGAAGFSVSGILWSIVITGTVNMLFAFIALGLVDRLGRRPLMLVGLAGIAAAHVLTGFGFAARIQGPFVVVCTLGAIAFYAMSLAPVIWVLIAEIFPNRIRGAAVSVAVSALWIACFVLTYTFPLMKESLGWPSTFWTYAGVCVAGFFFVWALVPETKGKSLEEIETSWHTIAPEGE